LFSDYRYKFNIGGYQFPVLNNLALCSVSDEVTFIRDEPDDLPPIFFFTSKNLEDLEDPTEVRSRAKLLLTLFHGALVLSQNSPNPRTQLRIPNLQVLYDLKTGHTHRFNSEETPGITAFSNSWLPREEERYEFKEDKSAKLKFTSNTIGRTLDLARNAEDVFTLLRQLGEELTYRNLYAVCDTIKFYAGKNPFEKLLIDSGHTKSQYKIFTHTANNFKALGTAARHGRQHTAPPSTLMPLNDAIYLVTSMCRHYFTNKYDLDYGNPVVNELSENNFIDEDF